MRKSLSFVKRELGGYVESGRPYDQDELVNRDVDSSIDKWGYSMLAGVIALAWADEIGLAGTASFALGFALAYLVILVIEVVASNSELRDSSHD